MIREDGKRETPAPPQRPTPKPTAKPTYNPPAWKKSERKQKDDEVASDPVPPQQRNVFTRNPNFSTQPAPQPRSVFTQNPNYSTQPAPQTRNIFSPPTTNFTTSPNVYQPQGIFTQNPNYSTQPAPQTRNIFARNPNFSTQPTPQQTITPPTWWNTLSTNVSNWIDNNVSRSQYVPAGLSQPQRPTTAAQFRPPVWGGNPMQVSEPSDPTQTPAQPSTGGVRNNGTVRVARGLPMIGTPSQSSTTANNGGGYGGGYGGTTYKKKGGSGGGYRGYSGGGYSDYSGYSSDRVPSWLMNLTNWNYKG